MNVVSSNGVDRDTGKFVHHLSRGWKTLCGVTLGKHDGDALWGDAEAPAVWNNFRAIHQCQRCVRVGLRLRDSLAPNVIRPISPLEGV